MRFLSRTGSGSLDLRRGSPVRGRPAGGAQQHAPAMPGSPSSVSSSDYVSVHDVHDFSPRPSSSLVAQHSHGRGTHGHSHARSASLAAKFSRAFSINRRNSGSVRGNATPRISTADIGVPLPSPGLSERWDGDYVRVGRGGGDNEGELTPTPTGYDPALTPTRRPTPSHSATFPGELSALSDSERLARRRGMLIEPELYLLPRSPGTPVTQHSITPASLRQRAAPSPVSPLGQVPAHLHLHRKSLPASRLLSAQPPVNEGSPESYLRARDVHRPSLPPLPLLLATATGPVESPLTSPISATSSSRFRIRRKPPPPLFEEDLFDVNADGASITTQASDCGRERGRLGRPLPSAPPPSRAPSTTPADRSPSTFQLELDRLFDELYNECRSGLVREAPASALASNRSHRRSQSEVPELLSANLSRGYAIRKQSRRILAPLRPDNATTLADPPHGAEVTRSNTAPKKNPFFQSVGGAGRVLGSRTRAMSIATPPSTPHTPGRVRSAVMEIERKNNGTPTTTVSTPIKCLGSILERAPSVNSSELTNQSKRMSKRWAWACADAEVEEARNRRSIR